MFYQPILLPLLAQVALTLLVWVYMYYRRLKEIGQRQIDPQQLDTRGHMQVLLRTSAAASDNLKNLFEMPVLFYLALLLSMQLLIRDDLLVTLSWAYVLLRAVHSLIHCTYNRVLHRFTVYFCSCLVLLLIWARLTQFIFS